MNPDIFVEHLYAASGFLCSTKYGVLKPTGSNYDEQSMLSFNFRSYAKTKRELFNLENVVRTNDGLCGVMLKRSEFTFIGRPMSSIGSPITVDGMTFVPAERIEKLWEQHMKTNPDCDDSPFLLYENAFVLKLLMSWSIDVFDLHSKGRLTYLTE